MAYETMVPFPWLESAAERISPFIRETPLTYDPNNDLFLKWENQQVTGSFKVRGALNKILSLESAERERGLVAASAGNHGQGVALAGKLVGAPVIIFASDHAVPAKVDAMRALGAEVRLVAGGYGEAEVAGLAYARENGSTWVSPYNDRHVIAGQGTLGLEVLRQLPSLPAATWVVPTGGGGLASGIGCAIKRSILNTTSSVENEPAHPSTDPKDEPVKLVAVQSEASPFFHALYHRGTQEGIVELPSLADGLAGPLEATSLTISLVRRYVDDFVLVSEAEIAQVIAYVWQRYEERIEGSGAAALAAVLSGKITSRPAVVILSGGNIQPEVHRRLVSDEQFSFQTRASEDLTGESDE